MTTRFELLIRSDDGMNTICYGYVEELSENNMGIGSPTIILKGRIDPHAFERLGSYSTYSVPAQKHPSLTEEEIEKLKTISTYEKAYVWGEVMLDPEGKSMTFLEAMETLKGVDIDIDPEIPDFPPLPIFTINEDDPIGTARKEVNKDGTIPNVVGGYFNEEVFQKQLEAEQRKVWASGIASMIDMQSTDEPVENMSAEQYVNQVQNKWMINRGYTRWDPVEKKPIRVYTTDAS